MSRATGAFARRASVAFAVLAGLLPGSAGATPVHVIGSGPPGAAAKPLRVPPRAPQPHRAGATASSVKVANVSEAGIRTNGKVFAVDPGGGGYSCSGTALNTPSRSIVLTAAHCVLSGGRAARRIAFAPAYDHGFRPYGTFRVKAVYVMPQWRRGENPGFDLAALRVAPNRLGTLADAVGGRGYVTSRSRLGGLQIFGYPAGALEGEELRSCPARGLGSDPLTFPFPGPPTMPAACDMAAGSSGGAWILGGQYVNGVTSYGYAQRPGRLYSPYFGPAVGSFLRGLP